MKSRLTCIGVLVPFFCILFAFAGIDHKNPTIPLPPASPKKSPDEAIPPVKPILVKPVAPKPGSNVEWFEYKPVKNLSHPTWGTYLTDIENHLPEYLGTQYRFADKNTWAHETTHGIHSHLNNNFSENRKYYCFYPGNSKAVKVKQPKFTIDDVSKKLPLTLRKDRYRLYFISQQKDWNTEPLYIWDEWVAYCNGLECGIELINKKLYKPFKNDSNFGVLEFSVYATYVAITQKDKDPLYDNKQFLEFLAWNLERSMKLYKEGQKLDEYNWENDKYLNYLCTSAEAKGFRDFLINTYKSEWTDKVFGFK